MIGGWGILCENALGRMSLDLNFEKSTIFLGNGLVPSGKIEFEPELWRHIAS